MTVKGKKSHYNVKLLRGFGVSINIKNNKIILKNGSHDITGESEKEEWFATKIPYERLYKFTHGIKMRNGKSMCQEITIAKITVQNLADFCIRKRDKLFCS